MPNADNPGPYLRGGQFYSPIQERLRTEDAVLSELRQPCSRCVPRHEHELAYVTIILQGEYLEGDRGKLDSLAPLTAVFNPAGATHSTLIGPAGASFFTIELCNQAVQQMGIRLPAETIFDRGAGKMLWPGLRLYSAFKSQMADPGRAERDVVEGYVLEILGAVSRSQPLDSTEPGWFRRAKERLHEEFREPFRMRDLARDAGVHPVHLARMFRKIERRTPGEYRQQLQVRAACELLRKPDWPLADIAARCGFADQSHLTRTFRKMTGMTPGQFRRTIVRRSTAA